MKTLKVKKLHPAAILPKYQTPGAACFDLHAHDAEWHLNQQAYGVHVTVGRPRVFDTGLSFEVPAGHVMLVFSRSGHGFKNDVRLSNCVGVIDSDYRGELRVKLTPDGVGGLVVNGGDRIAQAMLMPVDQWAIVEVDDISVTERGDGGFGSTGA